MRLKVLLLLFPVLIYCQDKKIFYHVENDSMISYRDQNNQYIIKPFLTPDYKVDRELDNSEIITDYFFITHRDEREIAVNRKGQFLFYPYYYDNGPDYLQEGLFRITDKHNKVGFANDRGEIVIAPKYDYASSFTMGFASYCNGCYFDRSKDSEHPILVSTSMYYIDKKGNLITPISTSHNPEDYQLTNGQFIPYQYGKYSGFEQQLITKVKSYQQLIDSYNSFYHKDKLDFEIIQKPTNNFPYYHVKAYINYPQNYFNVDSDDAEGTNFYINKNKEVFVRTWILKDNQYISQLIPILDWQKP